MTRTESCRQHTLAKGLALRVINMSCLLPYPCVEQAPNVAPLMDT